MQNETTTPSGKRQSNLVGQTFGRLIVIAVAPIKIGSSGRKYRTSLCRCACGVEAVKLNINLKSGGTRSCGCLDAESRRALNFTHGHTSNKTWTSTYSTWKAMRQRCSNPNNKRWGDYGGRGIKVCERWESFENFLADMGEKPFGTTIDRKNNSLGYCKDNCKWSTPKQQQRNMRSNVLVTVRGITACLSELCERFGTAESRVWHRMFKFGWSAERAFFEPKRKNQWG